jgi:hypothetical protein
MDVTRNVIEDLLPLVLAGEASEDSRALVEEYLARHPELARAARGGALRLPTEGLPDPPERDAEMRTLARAKRFLTWRNVLIACAVFFALFPVRYSANSHQWSWLPAESPISAVISVGLALACFSGYFWIRRALRGRR